jgi:hypothetical protein
MDDFTKKLWIFAALFCIILGAEIAVYIHEWNNFEKKLYDAPVITSKFARQLITLIDWDFGSYSSYIAILLYTSLLKQRGRAYLHVCLYCSMLMLCYTLQAIFSQPRTYDMSTSVGNQEPYSCRKAFGLPSAHCCQEFSLFLFCVIDYARFCNEMD